MSGGLGGGRRFEFLGWGPWVVPLWISGIFVGGVLKQRIFSTYTSRSPWSLELQRNLMFAASSGVIMRSEIFFNGFLGEVFIR